MSCPLKEDGLRSEGKSKKEDIVKDHHVPIRASGHFRGARQNHPKMDRNDDLTYDSADCFAWRRVQDVEAGESRVIPADLHEIRMKYEAARARKMEAEAMRAEIDLVNEQGRLMTVEDFGRVLEGAFTRVRIKLENAPPRLASSVVGVKTPTEAIQRIEPVIQEIIEELHSGDDIPDDEEDYQTGEKS